MEPESRSDDVPNSGEFGYGLACEPANSRIFGDGYSVGQFEIDASVLALDDRGF
jgi:hypothetical protein